MTVDTARAYFERGFLAVIAWVITKRDAEKVSDAVIDRAWEIRNEGVDAVDLLPPVTDTAPEASGVDWLAARFAAVDGLDWDEVCGYDTDRSDCGSGTCVAAHCEDHDAAACRDHYRRYARIALKIGGVS